MRLCHARSLGRLIQIGERRRHWPEWRRLLVLKEVRECNFGDKGLKNSLGRLDFLFIQTLEEMPALQLHRYGLIFVKVQYFSPPSPYSSVLHCSFRAPSPIAVRLSYHSFLSANFWPNFKCHFSDWKSDFCQRSILTSFPLPSFPSYTYHRRCIHAPLSKLTATTISNNAFSTLHFL